MRLGATRQDATHNALVLGSNPSGPTNRSADNPIAPFDWLRYSIGMNRAWPPCRLRRRARRRSRRAFSLIELLMVLAIVAILGSLYLSATSRSAQNVHLRNCQKNLQKIHLALEIYATDQRGGFPWRTNAASSAQVLDLLVPRYTADTASFICPGSKLSAPPSGESIAQRKISYAYYMGRRRSDPVAALMTDAQCNALSKTNGQLAFSATGDAPGNNHQKFGGNVLFTDGHVEASPAYLSFSLVMPQGIVLLNP